MKKSNDRKWFASMKYGAGWGLPIAWEAWLVLLTYITLVIAGGILVSRAPWWTIPFIALVLMLTGILIFICLKKGEILDGRH
jgi:hypothetical protein